MSMHIQSVRVQDFKRITSASADDLGSVVVVGGRNAQGKSSFIDAIWSALGGARREDTQPIHDGARQATAEVTLVDENGDGLVAKRVWKGETSRLTVTPVGSKAALNKPQSVLDPLIGKFAFDPLRFASATPRERRDILAGLVGVDLAPLEASRKELYEERTSVNRDVKRLKGSLDEMEPPAKGAAEVPDVGAVIEKRDELVRVQRGRQERYERIQENEKQAVRLQQQIAALEEENHGLALQINGADAWLGQQPAVAEYDAQIAAASQDRLERAAAERYKDTEERLKAAEDESAGLTESIAAVDEQKAAALAEANLPIEDLAFDDEDVLYKGVPFSQASQAERIRVSVAMAVAQNPEVKVVCVKDASLLDDESLALLRQLGEQHGAQLILEMVGAPTDATLVFEDGVA